MVEARLTDDIKLILFDTEKDKEIKSFPQKGTDPVKREAAEAKFKAMKQNIRQIVSSQKDYLKKLFLSGESIAAKAWAKDYLSNPVLMRIAQLLVWQQGKEEQSVLFTVKSGTTILADGNAYNMSESPVFLAHPIEMSQEQISAWQHYFLSKGLKQLFAQVWEPVAFRDISDIKSNRYNEARITVGHILGLENQGLVSYRFNSDSPYTDYTFADSMTIEGVIQSGARWLTEHGPQNEIVLGEIKDLSAEYPRKLNRVISYLDKIIIPGIVQKDDDVSLMSFLPGKTLAQIQDYLSIAIQNDATRCKSMLLDFKNKHFPDYPDAVEFFLD